MNRFDKLIKGLNLLRPFASSVAFEPVPNSFPFNGAPAHSSRAYCVVECGAREIWKYIDEIDHDFPRKLREIGWKSEMEDTYWIFE